MPKIYSVGDKLLATELTEIVKVAGLYATDGGTGDAYSITVTPAPSGYVTGDVYSFKAGAANTGPATLNVNGLGAKTIKKEVSLDLADNDILAGQVVRVMYDGTNFQMLSPIAPKRANGTTTFSATGTTTITCNFKPKSVRIHAVNSKSLAGNTYAITWSNGGFAAPSSNQCIWVKYDNNGAQVEATSDSSHSYQISGSGTSPGTHAGVVNNLTGTGFDISNTKTGTVDNVLIFWEAEA